MEENKKQQEVIRPVNQVKQEKMSYEQLENIAHQLSEQSKHLYAKLQEANMLNMFKRLDYLFKVVENSHAFNNSFVDKCISEIEGLITIPESEEKETEDTDSK